MACGGGQHIEIQTQATLVKHFLWHTLNKFFGALRDKAYKDLILQTFLPFRIGARDLQRGGTFVPANSAGKSSPEKYRK